MLEKTYTPRNVEDRLYSFWEENDLFRPEVNSAARKRFSIVIPPPNVTGTLHMGHALDNTLQDILIRWHRMLGDETLWMPGTDHAGIATQNVVERNLREKGLSKYELGREKFLEEVWTWAEARKGDILNQFRRLGISPDWSRQRFTLDEGLSKAVKEAFVRLYEKDLIYRGLRIVNWCPRCMSAISDIETDYIDEESFLWEISYPLSEGFGAIPVATTRPETMFGDRAVAVNPNDERFRSFIGKKVVLPLANVEIPLIADEYVDSSFGTGALKITPAHDPNDYEISLRHKLDPVWVINYSGHMHSESPIDIPSPLEGEGAAVGETFRSSRTDAGGGYVIPPQIQGLERFEARQKTEELLQQHGFLIKKVPHTHSVGHCQRCGTTIEPLLSKQWFVRCKPLAERAIESLEREELHFIPDRWKKIYYDWMSGIKDWCISRQLWWGHQIPAWYCEECKEVTVSATTPRRCRNCHSTHLKQETDVLDTWFSSGLWPFSTMGWPDTDSADFKRFYPTDVLVTGFDIIFFWVARMTMLGLELTGKSPFHTVYIHGLIRDEKGQKMSKSKGNTIDPVEIINEYGCDALRFSLTSLVTGGQDIKLSRDSFEKGKLFANKLWNASRFVLMNLEGIDDQPLDESLLSSMDRWILDCLSLTASTVSNDLNDFRFSDLTNELYKFIWNDFCDWYVEYSKKQLKDESLKLNTQRILLHVLDRTLRLLHPVMPYITDEIWQKLPYRKQISIMVSSYPPGLFDELVTIDVANIDRMKTVMNVIRSIREARQSSGIPHHVKTAVVIESPDDKERQMLEDNRDLIDHFVKLESLAITNRVKEEPSNTAVAVYGSVRIFVLLSEGTIDLKSEVLRQRKKLETLQKEQQQLSLMLSNPDFIDRAPVQVVEKNKIRRESLNQQIKAIEEQLSYLVER